MFGFISPGHSQATAENAKTEEGKDYHFRQYQGHEPFRNKGPGRSWLESRTKILGDYETVKKHFALLNVGAYHSKDVKDYGPLLALPSSRILLSWAQETLFPKAEAGKRIVICLQAAAYWGLDIGHEYGMLFAPLVTIGGHMVNSAQREKIREIVKKRIES